MLEFKNVSKNFGGLHVLDDVSFTVTQGGIFGLIGPNGAGKTTAFNLATGLLRPSGGSIRFNGSDLLHVPPHRITELGIARTFQNIRVFKEMSLLENVIVGMHDHLDYSFVDLLL
ncbi:MAG TPA: ATP-binding cassette domain-containing protein, partial [Burkholderiaceae bacterium]|nr:ATP-binding cassette domain-containing protein [Burkholderiaceae bacterium]